MPQDPETETPAPRLDLLIYAHDGRGLGHVSRSVAIGLAARRLYPHWRVLLLSGARALEMLAAGGELDWIKLPAYATRVTGGVSQGRSGPAGFGDADLGRLRGRIIADVVARLRPRCVLVDHQPQGKHRELLPALDAPQSRDSLWLLGLRGVVGEVEKIWSPLARECFQARYAGALWYGDSAWLGAGTLERFAQRFGRRPAEMGYVSRLRELVAGGLLAPPGRARWGGTVSIPWVGEGSARLLEHLAAALERLGARFGAWRVYVGFGDRMDLQERFRRRFQQLPACRLMPLGEGYLADLLHSRTALIYGGYNSLTDVLYAGRPCVAVGRAMQDGEQDRHLQRLAALAGDALVVLDESEADPVRIEEALRQILAQPRPPAAAVNLAGAEQTVHHLARWLTPGGALAPGGQHSMRCRADAP